MEKLVSSSDCRVIADPEPAFLCLILKYLFTVFTVHSFLIKVHLKWFEVQYDFHPAAALDKGFKSFRTWKLQQVKSNTNRDTTECYPYIFKEKTNKRKEKLGWCCSMFVCPQTNSFPVLFTASFLIFKVIHSWWTARPVCSNFNPVSFSQWWFNTNTLHRN